LRFNYLSRVSQLSVPHPNSIFIRLPQLRTRFGFLFNPNTSAYAEAFMRQAEAAALAIGIRLSATPFQDDTDLEHAIALSSEPGSGLIVLPEPSTNVRSAITIELAAPYRLLTLYAYRYQATGGAAAWVKARKGFRLQPPMISPSAARLKPLGWSLLTRTVAAPASAYGTA
jgi:hypothetical protein